MALTLIMWCTKHLPVSMRVFHRSFSNGRQKAIRSGLPALMPHKQVLAQTSPVWLNIPRNLLHLSSVSNTAGNSSRTRDFIAKNLQESIYKLHGRVSIHENRQNTLAVISLLLNDEIPEEAIVQLLGTFPELLRNKMSEWSKAIELVQGYGFSKLQTLSVLVNAPEVWKGDDRILYQVVCTLRSLGFAETNVYELIASHPIILDLSPDKITKRFTDMLRLFKKSDAIKTMVNSPSTFTDNWPSVQSKYLYVLNEMGIDENQIAKTKLLSHMLEDIQARHLFLQRSGVYIKPKKSEEKDSGNAALVDVVDTTDEIFATTVAGLSLEEYEIFKDLLHKEESYKGYRTGDMLGEDGFSSDEDEEDDKS